MTRPVGIRDRVRAGVDTIEHGTFLTGGTAGLMAERDVALVLTLGGRRVI